VKTIETGEKERVPFANFRDSGEKKEKNKRGRVRCKRKCAGTQSKPKKENLPMLDP